MSRSPAWEGFLDRVGETLVNLATIEVNTIEAAGMTGRKMPVWPQAILDVADRYFDYLAHGADVAAFWQLALPSAKRAVGTSGQACDPDLQIKRIADAIRRAIYPRGGAQPTGLCPVGASRSSPIATDAALGLPRLRIDCLTFLLLREAAQAMKRHPHLRAGISGEDAEKLVILSRIMRNSDQIIGLLQSLTGTRLEDFTGHARTAPKLLSDPVPPLPAAAATRLRKIWDINTERIVLQTLFQLDGDIVTRIAERAERIESNPLWQAHQQSLQLSLSHWERMFGVVEKLLRGR